VQRKRNEKDPTLDEDYPDNRVCIDKIAALVSTGSGAD